MPQTDLTKLNDTQSPSLSYVPSIQSNIQLMDDEDEYEYVSDTISNPKIILCIL